MELIHIIVFIVKPIYIFYKCGRWMYKQVNSFCFPVDEDFGLTNGFGSEPPKFG
jgi:hypothetical protein